MLYDFSGVIGFFSQTYTVKVPPARLIDPDTGHEYASDTSPTEHQVEAAVFPVAGAAEDLGAQFLPEGTYEADDYLCFVSKDVALSFKPYEGEQPPAYFLIDGEEFGVVKEFDWSLGNFRQLLLRRAR